MADVSITSVFRALSATSTVWFYFKDAVLYEGDEMGPPEYALHISLSKLWRNNSWESRL